ncbi:hypothetical protein EC991_008141 [Linnemannia zychae]|nr:hypothetical protein EC991_008141 [Linnemannia zychae]
MLFKHIIALTLAAVVASQKLDDCSVALNFPTGSENGVTEVVNCVFPELSHQHCLGRYRALRVAFKAKQQFGEEQTTCNYAVDSSVPISVTDFLNIPAVCTMLGGKMAFSTWIQCTSEE